MKKETSNFLTIFFIFIFFWYAATLPNDKLQKLWEI